MTEDLFDFYDTRNVRNTFGITFLSLLLSITSKGHAVEVRYLRF